MKEINFGTLCELLKEGLSEEIQFSGQIHVFTRKDTDSLLFSYSGEVSLEPRARPFPPVPRKVNNKYTITYGDNHKLYLAQREEIRMYNNNRGGRTVGPHIVIPMDISPGAILRIDDPKNIKY